MFRHTLTIIALAFGLAAGSNIVLEPTADAKPFEILSKSRKSGKRTHKKASSSDKKEEKEKSSRTSATRSTSNRRVVRTTTSRSSEPVRKNVRSRRTVRSTTRPAGSSSSTRTVKNVRPRTTTSRTTRTRTTRTTHRRGSTVRRTTYRRTSRSGHHHHTHTRSSTPSRHRQTSNVRGGGKSTVEAYLTGGLGLSGFASQQIVDGALPGAGYNLALGAKSGFFGAELGVNGGGYTFDPSSGSTDIGLVGLAGDLKLQPSIGFFEPYVKAGIGGYALADGVVEETATGVGLRLGAGADFRFRQWAFRLSYMHGAYGLTDQNGGLGGDVGARTETLGASLVFYF